MKKIVAIAAFLALSSSLVLAQGELRFGFQASPTFSWMAANTSRINPSGTNIGLKLGMIGEYFFQENYAFTTGIGFAFNSGGTLLHELEGEYWPDTDLGPYDLNRDGKLKYSIQYLEIPIGLKMRTREFGYMRYFLEPALILGVKTQARGSVKGTNVGNDEEKINIRDEVNNLNVAWGVGAGVEYGISENTSLIGGLGFQIGFLDVTDDRRTGTVSDPNQGDRPEDSKGTANGITLRLAVIF